MKSLIVVACVALSLPGCLVFSQDKTTTEGTEVTVESLKQILPGAPEDFVLSVLGPPTRRKSISDGTELLTWRYERTREQGTVIFLLFAGIKKSQESGRIFVSLEKQKVVRVWREGTSEESP